MKEQLSTAYKLADKMVIEPRSSLLSAKERYEQKYQDATTEYERQFWNIKSIACTSALKNK